MRVGEVFCSARGECVVYAMTAASSILSVCETALAAFGALVAFVAILALGKGWKNEGEIPFCGLYRPPLQFRVYLYTALRRKKKKKKKSGWC